MDGGHRVVIRAAVDVEQDQRLACVVVVHRGLVEPDDVGDVVDARAVIPTSREQLRGDRKQLFPARRLVPGRVVCGFLRGHGDLTIGSLVTRRSINRLADGSFFATFISGGAGDLSSAPTPTSKGWTRGSESGL